ncbi:MAG: hypothetical protein KAU03_03145, partial [Candidatus Altiarchaeales archaeon]|nr:hypothetical protein [Candidatus Altiarchaeales archaeon]
GSFRDYMSVERRKSELMPSDLKPCSNVDELRTMGVAGLIANLGSQREDIRRGAHDSLSRISREVETYTGVSEIRELMEDVKLLCPGMGEGGQVK